MIFVCIMFMCRPLDSIPSLGQDFLKLAIMRRSSAKNSSHGTSNSMERDSSVMMKSREPRTEPWWTCDPTSNSLLYCREVAVHFVGFHSKWGFKNPLSLCYEHYCAWYSIPLLLTYFSISTTMPLLAFRSHQWRAPASQTSSSLYSISFSHELLHPPYHFRTRFPSLSAVLFGFSLKLSHISSDDCVVPSGARLLAHFYWKHVSYSSAHSLSQFPQSKTVSKHKTVFGKDSNFQVTYESWGDAALSNLLLEWPLHTLWAWAAV